MPLSDKEKKERQMAMFGTTTEDMLLRFEQETGAERVHGVYPSHELTRYAMAIMSDAQESMQRGRRKTALQFINRAKKLISLVEVRTMKITDEIIDKIVQDSKHGYSYERYGYDQWYDIAKYLLKLGLTHDQAVEVLCSKLMRWTRDCYGNGTLANFKKYFKEECKGDIKELLFED